MLYKTIAKPVLFRLDPETAHHLTVNGLKHAAKVPGATAILRALYDVKDMPELECELWGMRFRHPLGLAAGLDKNAEAVDGFSSVGFAFVEAGTITPEPQPGNEKPRLFRLPQDDALINRMGFNNKGAKAAAESLRRLQKRRALVAVNIGKNKVTPNDRAVEDYRKCIRELYPYGDFFVVNVSSPNTPDLRKLQHGEELRKILRAVRSEMEQAAGGGKVKPFLVKIAPDLNDEELDAIVETVLDSEVSGIIATNTTISRDGLKSAGRHETGGLSGKPLKERSTEMIRTLYRKTEGTVPIIGVGGIFSGEDAYEKICAGASLVEIYTSLIYHGPEIVKKIQRELLEKLKADGLNQISQAVGSRA